MRRKIIDIDPIAVDTDGLSASAAVAGAGNLVLGGALASGGVYTADYARQITIVSNGADNGRTFTVTGTDANGDAQTEAITGPSTATVESAKYFKTVTSIAVDDACAGSISSGIVDEFVTSVIPLNYRNAGPATVSIEGISGTINISVQQTFSDVLGDPANIVWFACHSDITTITANAHAQLNTHASGVRLVCNSYSSGAELQMVICQDK